MAPFSLSLLSGRAPSNPQPRFQGEFQRSYAQPPRPIQQPPSRPPAPSPHELMRTLEKQHPGLNYQTVSQRTTFTDYTTGKQASAGRDWVQVNHDDEKHRTLAEQTIVKQGFQPLSSAESPAMAAALPLLRTEDEDAALGAGMSASQASQALLTSLNHRQGQMAMATVPNFRGHAG